MRFKHRGGTLIFARRLASIPLLAAGFLFPASIQATQSLDWEATHIQATRQELQELMDRFQAVSRSQAYSPELRAKGEQRVAAIRERLERGDFHVGDRVLLDVRDEPQLSDTFLVSEGPALDLPLLGKVTLRGVLRSELETYLTQRVAEFIQDPVVRARAMIRLSVLGQVNEPGFYLFPLAMPLADALMTVGGPTDNANFDKTRIRRGEREIWEGERLQTAIVEGRTLEELDLRTGDRVQVPAQPGANPPGGVMRFLAPAIPAVLTAILIRVVL